MSPESRHPRRPHGPQDPPPRFADLGLSPAALGAVAAAGWDDPTPVQQRAIPPALAGRDVIAVAATGTGKTAAFVLPIVERLAGRRGTRALVLAPTRELVQQIADQVRLLGGQRGVRCVEIVGGLGMEPQVRGLREHREVVVATPGRLIDHLDRGARLDGIEILVLDEADRMLDMGFKPQMERILDRVPDDRQTMLLSATMGDEVTRFARACLREPVRIEVIRSGTVAARAEQRVLFVPQHAKLDLLQALLRENDLTTLVFTRTKHRAERLAKALDRAGFAAARIHGDRSQSQRQMALDGFRSGRFRVLVATDVAARGLDVEEIGHVVCFDLSLVPDDHVHRVGRTARASASGLATSFCSPEETQLLREIERFTRTPIPRAEPPEGFEVKAPPPKTAHGHAGHGGHPSRRHPAEPGHRRGGHRAHRSPDDRDGDDRADAPHDDEGSHEAPRPDERPRHGPAHGGRPHHGPRQPGPRPHGPRPGGHPPGRRGPGGHRPGGHGPQGQGPKGHGPGGHGPKRRGPGGPRGWGPSRHGPGGFDRRGPRRPR